MSCTWASTVHDTGECIWIESQIPFTPATDCVWASTVHDTGECIWIENVLVEARKKGGGGPDFEPERRLEQIFREDEEILAILMAYTLH